MDTMEMITKALEAVVEQKVAEKATTVNLDSVIEFIKTANDEEITHIFNAISDTDRGDELLDNFYQNKLEADDSIINKDELTIGDVDDAGLLEDCFNHYVDNCYDQKSLLKDIIDRI